VADRGDLDAPDGVLAPARPDGEHLADAEPVAIRAADPLDALAVGVIYRMASVYAARQGYTRADVGRVGVALFLAGGLVGGGVV
jgi:hypothetical protein